MCGEEPSHVPDEVIAEIRARERNGAIELPRHKLKAGDRVQIISGLLAGRRGRYAGASHRHVKVLLQMLGIERQVQLSPGRRRAGLTLTRWRARSLLDLPNKRAYSER
jgi:transcription antitermination factor NusG